jgi:hypothetical protein
MMAQQITYTQSETYLRINVVFPLQRGNDEKQQTLVAVKGLLL